MTTIQEMAQQIQGLYKKTSEYRLPNTGYIGEVYQMDETTAARILYSPTQEVLEIYIFSN